MAKYEFIVIFDPFLQETDYPALTERVRALIEKHGGLNIVVDNWGKRRLAYPIAKKPEGFYIYVTFDGEVAAAGLSEIERTTRLNENVLREMLTRIPAPKRVKPVKVKKVKPAGENNYYSDRGGERNERSDRDRRFVETRSAGDAGAGTGADNK